MDAPFYVLSSGDDYTDADSPNTSISSSSHDSSRAAYHYEDVTTFAEELNCAAKSAFPNRGRSRYESVNVCLIRWEEDELEVEPELRRLNNVFQDYGFNTNVWEIPSRNSHLDLMIKTGEFIRSFDNDRNLFVVYYGGHGRIDAERQAEWTCKRDPNYARVHWSAIQTLFAEALSDTLILLDTCAAASATTRSQYGSMEVIMASGFEARAPPPGEHSFTNTLVDVLESWVNKQSFSASCLHAEILTKLKMKPTKKGREGMELEWCVTPIHLNCTQNSTALGIELCRRNVLPRPRADIPENHTTLVDAMDIDFDSSSTAQSPLSSLSPNGRFKTPHVLISVALEEDQPDLDSKRTARWLESIPFLAKWAKVECVFPSYSSLLVLSVPVPIWNMLPDHPACFFIGYVTGPNLVVSSSLSTATSIRGEKKAHGDVKMEKILEDEALSTNSHGLVSIRTDSYICFNEIKKLDPMKDNDVLKEFTYEWLTIEDSKWPFVADIRMKLFMHERNFYPLEDPDSKILDFLVTRLRRGTEVETCATNEYICLKQRVSDRLCVLVKDLFEKTLLEYNMKGAADKTENFRRYWDKRYEIWDYGQVISFGSTDGVYQPLRTFSRGPINISPTQGRGIESNSEYNLGAPHGNGSGCWTCLFRNLKCEQGKPKCQQCSTVGVVCEYGRPLWWYDEKLNKEQKEINNKLIKDHKARLSSSRARSPAAAKSIVSNKHPQSTADSGYWTADMRRDMESTGSPIVTTSRWEDDSWRSGLDPGGRLSTTDSEQDALSSSIVRDEDGSWKGGLAPEDRERIINVELTSLDEQEQLQLIASKISDVQHWRSQLASTEFDAPGPSCSDSGGETSNTDTISKTTTPDKENGIPPVDDAVSVHENRLVEGQVYFNPEVLNEVDSKLSSQPRHWNDGPSLPYITTTTLQPPTSNEALKLWYRQADDLSIVSRAATWGTRRRSEPNLLDFQADSTFLTRISLNANEQDRTKHRSGSIFGDGLDRLANIVRRKRARSDPRQCKSEPPSRVSSFGRSSTPSMKAAVASMAVPLGAVGAPYARSGSIQTIQSAPPPRSSPHWVSSKIVRTRSEGALEPHPKQSGLVELWRQQGGPPVINLPSPHNIESKATANTASGSL